MGRELMGKRLKKQGNHRVEEPTLVPERIYLLSGYNETKGMTVRARYHGERQVQGEPAYAFTIVDGPKIVQGPFQARVSEIDIHGKNIRYIASQGGNA